MTGPNFIAVQRDWDDYSIGRADAIEHLGALDPVYAGVIEAHRAAIEATDEPDPGSSGPTWKTPAAR